MNALQPGRHQTPPPDVIRRLAGAPVQWWICGGRALQLYAGVAWRVHDDTDVGVQRRDVPRLVSHLADWRLTPKIPARATGGSAPAHPGPTVLFAEHPDGDRFDLVISDGDTDDWISRSDASVRMPWERAVLIAEGGVPIVAPEIELFGKSRHPRPKDTLDAQFVIPQLSASRAAWLARALPPDHPWRSLLR